MTSPSDRAKAVLAEFHAATNPETASPDREWDIVNLIAQAITQAENDKLEEAASRLILETQPKPDQSFSVGDEILMHGTVWSAAFVRSLKTKD